ncbi:MAG: PAS domain-containing sensor histidine kinase [Burkholderiales bacterium]|nr:MAG: PAS domain-containing sensor histidine kinase [Burkholderiales bacterium]
MSDPGLRPAATTATPFEELARFLPGAIFRYRVATDGAARLEYMSPACLEIWELPASRLEHDMADLWGRVDPRDLQAMRHTVDDCAERLVDWDHQWRITTPSGRRKWLHGMGRPTRDVDGSLLWHVFVVDQTDSRAAQEGLRLSEERFRRLIDAIPDVAVQGYDANLICRFWNGASARLYGYSEQEAVGTNLLDLIIPDSMRSEVMAATRHMLETGEAIPSAELVLQHKDGSSVRVYSGHVMLSHSSAEPSFFCIDFDLSERQRAEDARQQLQSQLREAQKMEALGTLAGGIAHDFNNILAAILGNAALALEDCPEDSPSWTSLREIQKAARRARAVVHQILAFARRQEARRSVLDLRVTSEEVLSLLRATAPAGVSIEFTAASGLPAVVGDPSQFEQVLLNLGTNAVQAVSGHHQAKVCIELARMEAPLSAGPDDWQVLTSSAREGQAGVLIRVTDNGPGMTADTAQRIFEPFFTTKPRGQGTGLGLAVVHGILKEHDASVLLRTRDGVGTCFEIWMPATDRPADASADTDVPAPASARRTESRRVLYVDDDALLTDLVFRQLTRAGHQVTTESDPREALRRLEDDPQAFDLLISDHNMPQMSGLDMVTTVQQIRPSLPVILTSAVVSDELRAKAERAGVALVIEKAGSANQLADEVARHPPNPRNA